MYDIQATLVHVQVSYKDNENSTVDVKLSFLHSCQSNTFEYWKDKNWKYMYCDVYRLYFLKQFEIYQ